MRSGADHHCTNHLFTLLKIGCAFRKGPTPDPIFAESIPAKIPLENLDFDEITIEMFKGVEKKLWLFEDGMIPQVIEKIAT